MIAPLIHFLTQKGTKMRILQLVSSLSGGAGTATRNLNFSLNKMGISSAILARNQKNKPIESNENTIDLNFFETFQSRFVTLSQEMLIQKTGDLVTPVSLGFLSKAKLNLNNFDIFHIHSFFNLLSINDLHLLKATAKPIFFTLHDQRLFTGGCHCSRDCENFLNKCERCPQINAPFKKLANKNQFKLEGLFNNFQNAHFISPSKWLADLANSSQVLRGKEINHINNSIAIRRTLPSREKSRAVLGLTKNDMVLGFVSPDLNNSYKGFNILVSALSHISHYHKNKKLILIIIGKGKVPAFDENISIIHLESVPNNEMFSIFSAMDLLVVPSTQDNSPNVILESLMVGTPVVGSQIGGITELLCQFDLPSFQPNDYVELSEIIMNFKLQYDRIEISVKASDLFGFENTTVKIAELYSKAI